MISQIATPLGNFGVDSFYRVSVLCGFPDVPFGPDLVGRDDLGAPLSTMTVISR